MTRTDGPTLDAPVRDWVLVPIVVFMLLVGAARHHAGRILRANESTGPVDVDAVADANAALRAERTLRHAGYLSSSSFASRREWHAGSASGRLRARRSRGGDAAAAASELMRDPTKLTSAMSKNALGVIPQMLAGAWVNFFFHGFVVGRVPFALSQRFRGMLQRGVALRALDVTYVSSLSWYFLNLFGLGGVFRMCFGASEEELDPLQAQRAMTSGVNVDRAFKGIAEGFAAVKHEHTVGVADARATKILRALNEGKTPNEARREAAMVKR